MQARFRATCALSLTAAVALAGCSVGLDEDGFSGLEPLRVIQERLGQGDGPPPPLSQAQIDQAVTAVQLPLKFIEIEARGAQAVIAATQTNGAYTTYASSQGQHVVFRDGFAVQSRGFGGDLMSSDEDELLALLRARQRGTADYVMRYLSGDEDTVTYRYICNVLPQGPATYAAGAVRSAATDIEVQCVSETGPDFVSDYTVGAGGDILAGRQWFGGLTDYLSYRTLRAE
ncbi:hypothetical protein ROJ8625_00775 [Roseivivax jejudonensis]|uniref:Group 4 capsule polysaccharide lipoprotein gfcB, YjbF n=1 Tax=Roseivivax jejudonensis TaxID=1529041 RepID=A0A1X6YGV2_9RHOB|nr:YjbF family lipoprotein [Roseivivax jejudonensis]SLN21142.1 hypothetical protein ROJ8625_00775 [Roseivivax jejudonensis]